VTKVLDTIRLVNEQGVSVLLVEQSLHKALAIADYGYVIQTGRIVMEGAGKDLLNNEDIKKAYLGL
jgi:branched-chain amino acid transport system ATP-binding protein